MVKCGAQPPHAHGGNKVDETKTIVITDRHDFTLVIPAEGETTKPELFLDHAPIAHLVRYKLGFDSDGLTPFVHVEVEQTDAAEHILAERDEDGVLHSLVERRVYYEPVAFVEADASLYGSAGWWDGRRMHYVEEINLEQRAERLNRDIRAAALANPTRSRSVASRCCCYPCLVADTGKEADVLDEPGKDLMARFRLHCDQRRREAIDQDTHDAWDWLYAGNGWTLPPTDNAGKEPARK